MSEKKRWQAMYTKHITQKRKVYHDGFLELQIAGKKVMLYDESDNLLESIMLKADDVVSTGETLRFQGYIVDICDLKDGQSKGLSDDVKSQPTSDEKKCVRKPFAISRPNFKKGSLHSGMNSGEESKRGSNLVNKIRSNSPSHKMIGVFKKRELHKYASLSPKPTTTTTTTTQGTAPLFTSDKEMNNHPLINSPGDGKSNADTRLKTDTVSNEVPPHQPLRNVNQILSILQRNVTEIRSDDDIQMPKFSTEVPPKYDINKKPKTETISPKVAAASTDSVPQKVMVGETSSDSKTVSHLNDNPSFDLGF